MAAMEETQVGERGMNKTKSKRLEAGPGKPGTTGNIPFPDAAAVARVLGIRTKIRSGRDLPDLVLRGLPKSCLQRCASRVTSDPGAQRKIIHRIVPPSTYRRRKRNLTSVESDRTSRLARVIATAVSVWNDEETAGRFLTSIHPIPGATPLDLCDTDSGTRRVEEILWVLHSRKGGNTGCNRPKRGTKCGTGPKGS
jgi:putative toxin-antitoxin system antitoxin component (TIGR02293 family)